MTSSSAVYASIFLVANGLTLAFSLSFLLIILWYDIRRVSHHFFALFLVLVAVWNVGYILRQANTLVSSNILLDIASQGIASIGFTGAGACLYALCASLATPQRRFRILASIAIVSTLLFNGVVILNQISYPTFARSQQNFNGFLYVLFSSVTVFLVYRYRRTIQNPVFVGGVIFFVAGQGFGLVDQEIGIAAASLLLASSGCLVISVSFIRRELITPLINRNQQLETMHEVSLAISSRITTDTLLNEISMRATHWLQADASAIYLMQDEQLVISTTYGLPVSLLHASAGQKSLARQVSDTRQSRLVSSFSHEWLDAAEFSAIAEAFGSVIGTPLLYDDQVIGVLIVIASSQNRLLTKDDVRLLELLASQASVAIATDRLFTNRSQLLTQIEETNEQLQTVLTSTKSPVVAMSRDTRIVFVNRSARELFISQYGVVPERITPEIDRRFLPANLFRTLHDIQRFGVSIYEIQIAEKTYQCHLAGWGSPHLEGWVAVLHDVTELKELDRIKSEMVRMTSHDLKNPLQAALANIDLLHEDIELIAPENAEIQLSVANVERQLLKMQRIISGILDLERVRLGVNLAEVCSPIELVLHATEELQDVARDKGVQLETYFKTPIADFSGDKAQFERALVNLIDNAIKFSPNDAHVWVGVEQNGNQIHFTVTDEGVGIPPELHERIFERFFRGRQHGIEHVSGSGLGLSLVKAVIDSHHGTIRVSSATGKGTMFEIFVPTAHVVINHQPTQQEVL